MQVARLKIERFRGVRAAEIDFDGHALLIGRNNVGKSAICEALELALGADRQGRFPVVDEYDFYNARYLDEAGEPVTIRIEVLLINVTPTLEKAAFNHLERWDPTTRTVLGRGDARKVDAPGNVWCLRLVTIARYNKEEDEFESGTHYAKVYDPDDEASSRVPRGVRRSFGFLYLRALRTGSRALSLERGSLLDVILRVQSLQTGIWEHVRRRLEDLTPPIDDGATQLAPVLQTIEARLAEYMPLATPGNATKLFVSQLTREHLRKTLSFFISVTDDQRPVPFQHVGSGTLNALVLALLSFIAELKAENVMFAMEEPEISLPPHTQRRIATYLLTETTQCFVTSHSPYVMECFDPARITILRRDGEGTVTGRKIELGTHTKTKTYRRFVRRAFSEAMLGCGVIVVEGLTEQLCLRAVAERMELAEPNRHPLDLAGVTILSADGDGTVAELGRFFVSLDMPVFAFLDKKTRNAADRASLDGAGFETVCETDFFGMETLLSTELPVDLQWSFLDRMRAAPSGSTMGIPPVRPDDNRVRELTSNVLKSGKGWGRAAELIELCETAQLPRSIVAFLETIYDRFRRPAAAAQAKETEPNDASPAPKQRHR